MKIHKFGGSSLRTGKDFGRVVEISFEYSPVGDSRVPVLIEIDAGTLSKAVEDIKDEGQVLAGGQLARQRIGKAFARRVEQDHVCAGFPQGRDRRL